MAVSSLVAASGGKTMFRTTLTSGTSYTVPAGVTYLNVTLMGGGGGGSSTLYRNDYTGYAGRSGQVISSTLSATAGNSFAYAIGAGGGGANAGANGNGSAGGDTTFTGATTAIGGNGNRNGTTASLSNNAGGGNSYDAGGTGGGGAIYIEYWA